MRPGFVQTLLRAAGRIGADPADSDEVRIQKSLMVTGSFFFIGCGLLWGLIYLLFGLTTAGLVPISYSVVSLLSVVTFAFTRRFQFYRLSQLVLMLLLPSIVMLALGGFIQGSAVVLWAFAAPLGAILFDEPHRAPRWALAYVVVLIGSVLIQPYLPPPRPLPAHVIQLFFILNTVGVPLVTFTLLYYFVGQKNLLLALLRTEQQKSENLLLNILPKEIAAILKNEQRTIADHFAGASILFADMVGFTPMTATLAPAEMLGLLNDVFSYFDSLVDKYGLEKIRTIGDSYMVASGVPRPRPDHAQALARLALDMRRFVQTNEQCRQRQLTFRIGLNSGPVVAGVIGRKKFIYDLWGDAVNTASRMESHGTPGCIQITRETYALLKDEFVCEPRGTITVKGKGEMETWYLVDERAA